MMKNIFFIAITFSTLIGCKSIQTTAGNDINQQDRQMNELFVEANTWELIRYNGQLPEEAGFKRKIPTMVINLSEKRVGGNSGCNSYGGEVIIEGNTMHLNRIMSTKMYCVDVPEHEFFQMLRQPLQFEIKDDVLSLEQEGVVILEFKLKKDQ